MGLYFSYIQYNQIDISLWPFPAGRIAYIDLNAINSVSSSYTDSSNIMANYNVWWGFTRFNFANQTSLHMNSAQTNITIQTSSALPFANLDLTMLIFQFKECDPSTPYYMISQDLCYDICPKGYYEDIITVPSSPICTLCTAYDCAKCSSPGASCTSCDTVNDFRVLNTNNITNISRCIPVDGYYDVGNNTLIA